MQDKADAYRFVPSGLDGLLQISYYLLDSLTAAMVSEINLMEKLETPPVNLHSRPIGEPKNGMKSPLDPVLIIRAGFCFGILILPTISIPCMTHS